MHSRLAFQPGIIQQAPVRQRQYLFSRQRITAIFTDWLLSCQTFSHRFITMNEHRQQSALALQPKLVNIVLNLAANTEVINQNMCTIRQRLLMQSDMAVGIHIDDCQRVLAQTQQLVGYLRGITR